MVTHTISYVIFFQILIARVKITILILIRQFTNIQINYQSVLCEELTLID